MRASLLLLAAIIGCGSSTTSLSGKVNYEGKPVEKGYMTLQPADGQGQTESIDIVGGQYSKSGLTPGKKVVTIESVRAITFPKSSAEMAEAAERGGPPPAPANEIPRDAKGNGETIELKPGSQKHDFNLSKPPTPAP